MVNTRLTRGMTVFNWTDEQINEYVEAMEKYTAETNFPLIIEFEGGQGVYDGHAQHMTNNYPKHSKLNLAYNNLNGKQKTYLMKKGLEKDHDSSLTKFCLSCCHGMTEKQHIVTESYTSVIYADEDEVAKAEAFEEKRQVEL